MSKKRKAKEMFIIYDQRAAGGHPDKALVLDTADTLEEAREAAKVCHGVIFAYDVVKGVGRNQRGPIS